MKAAVLFIYLLVSSIAITFGSTVTGKYTIEVAGIKIGNLLTSKMSKGDLTYYKLESKVSIWLFFQITITHDMICVYNKNVLQYVIISSNINKEHYSSHIEWAKDHHEVNINTYKYKNTKPIAEPIYFSVAKLFFEEPLTQHKILAENFGVMVPIKSIKTEVYALEVTGKTNKYTYKNGEMIVAEMESPIKNFIIRKVK